MFLWKTQSSSSLMKIWIMRKILLPITGIIAAVFVLTAFCDCSMHDANAESSLNLISDQPFEDVPILPADSPMLISPVYDFSTYENLIQLKWTSVDTCMQYEVLVSRNVDFSDSTTTFKCSDTLFTFNGEGLMRGVVFWKVRSIRGNGEFSSWSEFSRFTLLGRIDIDRDVNERIVAPCNGNCANCTRPCGRRRPVPDM
ncbi:MAG: hypothetical protein C0592_01865 [Marinilabiliales bacterium]|nr:MAG: hypothetical protein C0592_01865 [Marinilabiliales bacterium]